MKASTAHQTQVDRNALETKVKTMYTEVALHPEGNFHFEMGRALAERLGYPFAALDQIPTEAIESFAGVGYFFHLAKIAQGERIVDLGSGSGMDAFIAATQTGSSGIVFGIDMTDQQLIKALALAESNGVSNVHFHKGYIEEVPVPDAAVDVVISNGVINLSADKAQAFREVARILRPGGRLVFSDIVSTTTLPENISCNVSLWAACIGGAVTVESYVKFMEDAGLQVVLVEENPEYAFLSNSAKGATKDFGIKSISVLARK